MRIENSKLYIAPVVNKQQNKTDVTSKNVTNSIEYNPPYYKDFNVVSFGERLFRTPANFFEQDFNRNGMPKLMKDYLFDDYEDRQNMPPNQMMKLVYGDLKYADTLDDVKFLFQDKNPSEVKEPLFADLSDKPKIKARAGIIPEIELMREEGKTLFKNGKDNLGVYILKKIYLEGKTLKEINTDFSKDVSAHFKGLSPIEYSTLEAYGIKFPNRSFWKSFIATREDFPYEYKPRKAIESSVAPRNVQRNTPVQQAEKKPAKKRFAEVQDWEINKITDAMIKGNGNLEETKRQFKKLNVRDEATLTFNAKYMGEINSVVLEKLHISEEMMDFYTEYSEDPKKEQEFLSAYWKDNTTAKELRSMIMKDTIKLFMDAYGVDGENDEFRELIEYAHSLKPNRIERKIQHDKMQAEYDEMFAALPEEKLNEILGIVPEVKVEEKQPLPSMESVLDEALAKYKAQKYDFISPACEKISILVNLDEEFEKKQDHDLAYLPTKYRQRFKTLAAKSPLVTEDYKKSLVLYVQVPEEVRDQLPYTLDEIQDISDKLEKSFVMKYPLMGIAAGQAIRERVFARDEASGGKILNGGEVSTLNDMPVWSTEERVLLDADFELYSRPVTSKQEVQNLNKALTDFVVDAINSPKAERNSKDYLLYLLSANMRDNAHVKNHFSRVLRQTKFIETYGGGLRALNKPELDNRVKVATCKFYLDHLFEQQIAELMPLLVINEDNIKTYVPDTSLRDLMLQESKMLKFRSGLF